MNFLEDPGKCFGPFVQGNLSSMAVPSLVLTIEVSKTRLRSNLVVRPPSLGEGSLLRTSAARFLPQHQKRECAKTEVCGFVLWKFPEIANAAYAMRCLGIRPESALSNESSTGQVIPMKRDHFSLLRPAAPDKVGKFPNGHYIDERSLRARTPRSPGSGTPRPRLDFARRFELPRSRIRPQA